MIVGSAGIVTAIASLVLSFRGGGNDRLIKAAVLVGALLGLWVLSRTGPVDRALSRGIAWLLTKGRFATRDYAMLLELSGDYAVGELHVRDGDWIANRSLRELRLRDEGVVVMGIHRRDKYVGAPGPDEVIEPCATLVVYGRESRIDELDRRQRDARRRRCTPSGIG